MSRFAPDFASLANALLPSVLAAGALELAYFEKGVSVEAKPDDSPVTVADREAETILVAGLAAAAPGIQVIAEEAVACGRLTRAHETFFLVDPLDGTREFIAGIGEFTINIGLISDCRPVFGLIFAPALSELYVTVAPGEGAAASVLARGGPTSLGDLRLRPLAARAPDRKAMTLLESRNHSTPGLETLLVNHTIGERMKAGSSLKFCVLADGRADLYARLGATCEWDTAAGDAILAASGGAVTTLAGEPLAYGKSQMALVNPPFMAWGRPTPPPW